MGHLQSAPVVTDGCEDLCAAVVGPEVGAVIGLGSKTVCDGRHVLPQCVQRRGSVAVQHRPQCRLIWRRHRQPGSVILCGFAVLAALERIVASLNNTSLFYIYLLV